MIRPIRTFTVSPSLPPESERQRALVYNLPLTLERDPEGGPPVIEVEYPGRMVAAQIWRAQVGRVALYLLDANINRNGSPDQDITDQLYGGDAEMRLKQEKRASAW